MKLRSYKVFLLVKEDLTNTILINKDFFVKFDLGSEENSQLCIYVKGEKVVDLWGR